MRECVREREKMREGVVRECKREFGEEERERGGGEGARMCVSEGGRMSASDGG